MDERSFPAPWHFEEIPDSYRVLDANDRVLSGAVRLNTHHLDRSAAPRTPRGVVIDPSRDCRTGSRSFEPELARPSQLKPEITDFEPVEGENASPNKG
jgi:hypothetical protein